ncbi:MAG: TonB C-terminal domain-containing protein [Myxococcota bacterium]
MNPFHLTGAMITALVHGLVVVMLVVFSNCSDASASGNKLEMVTIEAALAFKSETKSKQPQKQRKRKRSKRPVAKREGVSRDEQKKAAPQKPKKPDKPAQSKPEDFSDDFEKYLNQRQRDDEEEEDDLLPDDDSDSADSAETGGQFDGSERGFAEVNKGDPYVRDLMADFYEVLEIPTLEKGSGSAVGCIHLSPDGSIEKYEFQQSSENANIDRAVKLALKRLQKKRKTKSKPVPKHLLDLTKQWTCFRPKKTAE